MTTQSLRHVERDDRPPPIPSQTDVVVDGIKSMIIRGQLDPGAQLLREKDLALVLDVSRDRLREGVRPNHLRVAG
jgi:GntR family transcriptional regulator, transcriptional repressor for pyruvate dehydrogenase complex